MRIVLRNQLTQPPALSSTLKQLSIDSSHSQPTKTANTLPESWEDSASDNDEPETPLHQQSSYPSAPPPTPISPSYHENSFNYRGEPISTSEGRAERGTRPDKTDAVAKRLIAGALGVKAPKRTEEQRKYDRALKEKEMKRRNEEKEALVKAKEEAEKAKNAVWED